jgi:hypothetical protein
MKRNLSISLKKSAAAATLGACLAASGSPAAATRANVENANAMAITTQPLAGRSQTPAAPQSTTNQSKFYCNIKALNPEQRARHQELTAKLIAARTAIVESDKGYEFQFTPSRMSLAELAEWATAESKCCPFFDFHLDLENEGQLLCLRLTGQQGIKPFIRAEFQVP